MGPQATASLLSSLPGLFQQWRHLGTGSSIPWSLLTPVSQTLTPLKSKQFLLTLQSMPPIYLSTPHIFIMIPTISLPLPWSPSFLSAFLDILPPFFYLGLDFCLFPSCPGSVLSASLPLLVLSHPLSAALSPSSLVSAPLLLHPLGVVFAATHTHALKPDCRTWLRWDLKI